MNATEIMALYNQYERIQVDVPGWKKVTEPQLVKMISPDLDASFISYFEFSSSDAPSIIDQQKNIFTQLGKSFEWKVYDCDKPADIGQHLLNKGFFEEEVECFMALDLRQIKYLPEPQLLCLEVCDEAGIRDAIEVKQIQTGDDCQGYFMHLMNLKHNSPESIKIYVVYDQGRPVSSAWIIFNGDSPFAGIWGGSTIANYRGRGYYQALLSQRIRDAVLAGKRFLIIDASAMSRPIVEKYGFQLVAKTIPYRFVCL